MIGKVEMKPQSCLQLSPIPFEDLLADFGVVEQQPACSSLAPTESSSSASPNAGLGLGAVPRTEKCTSNSVDLHENWGLGSGETPEWELAHPLGSGRPQLPSTSQTAFLPACWLSRPRA